MLQKLLIQFFVFHIEETVYEHNKLTLWVVFLSHLQLPEELISRHFHVRTGIFENHLCFSWLLPDNKAVECTGVVLAGLSCSSTSYYSVFLLFWMCWTMIAKFVNVAALKYTCGFNHNRALAYKRCSQCISILDKW